MSSYVENLPVVSDFPSSEILRYGEQTGSIPDSPFLITSRHTNVATLANDPFLAMLVGNASPKGGMSGPIVSYMSRLSLFPASSRIAVSSSPSWET